jgi:hypothetical protein
MDAILPPEEEALLIIMRAAGVYSLGRGDISGGSRIETIAKITRDCGGEGNGDDHRLAMPQDGEKVYKGDFVICRGFFWGFHV